MAYSSSSGGADLRRNYATVRCLTHHLEVGLAAEDHGESSPDARNPPRTSPRRMRFGGKRGKIGE
jgi:hypothetical protein